MDSNFLENSWEFTYFKPVPIILRSWIECTTASTSVSVDKTSWITRPLFNRIRAWINYFYFTAIFVNFLPEFGLDQNLFRPGQHFYEEFEFLPNCSNKWNGAALSSGYPKSEY